MNPNVNDPLNLLSILDGTRPVTASAPKKQVTARFDLTSNTECPVCNVPMIPTVAGIHQCNVCIEHRVCLPR
jgi:hypothetical protein